MFVLIGVFAAWDSETAQWAAALWSSRIAQCLEHYGIVGISQWLEECGQQNNYGIAQWVEHYGAVG